MRGAVPQVVARHDRAVGTNGGKIWGAVADIAHLASRPANARRVRIGAHEIDHVPACVIVQRGAQRRHDVTDAVGDPPVEVAVGVIVDMVGGEIGRLHPEEPAGGTIAPPAPSVAGRAVGGEQVGAMHD